ncbi:MAG TPA: signal peptidase I [Paludibacteraceae bacterium]|nr:signal peptidase I [Paludibacteraceae bacterium]
MKNRFKKPAKNWIKCAIWSIIYILFIAWIGNYWWLFLLPFIVDIFVTRFIPWDFWKKTKNKILYTIFSWVDAIVFALVAVYFINLYLFQNYQIPTSSLEKSLLVGDFLFVSKASYGPRIPNTPFSFPLVQHTFPEILGGGKSYIEKPQWEYRRLKGWDTVTKGDIVVFNFPAGDTVATKIQNPDYYTLCYYLGRDYVHQRNDVFGDVVWRPVDRRENYVKRCVATPGDTLHIRNNVIYINGEKEDEHEGLQLNYYVQTNGSMITESMFEKLNVSKEDRRIVGSSNPDEMTLLMRLGFDTNLPIYRFPMTEEAKSKLETQHIITKIAVEPDLFAGRVFPIKANYGWSRDNFGPLYIPKKGATVELTLENLPIYEQIIRNYERNTLEVKDDTIYINSKSSDSYTFKMDYYWMVGDNRHNSADSRYWGFVPEDHIVGRPVLVWLSLDKDKSLFQGKIRWKRFFKDASK